jgi:hypothetical protein
MSQQPNCAILLERGVAVRQGLRFLRAELPGILATQTDVLSPRVLRILEDLSADWRHLDARIEGLSGELETLAHQDQHCTNSMSTSRPRGLEIDDQLELRRLDDRQIDRAVARSNANLLLAPTEAIRVGRHG